MENVIAGKRCWKIDRQLPLNSEKIMRQAVNLEYGGIITTFGGVDTGLVTIVQR